MKLTLITILCLIGLKGFTQEIPNDPRKWQVPYNTYGVTYYRIGATIALEIPEYIDTPVISYANRINWKNHIGRRVADNSLYIHNGIKWTKIGANTTSLDSTYLTTISGDSRYYTKALSDSRYAALSHVHAYSSLTGIPSTFTPSAHNHLVSDLSQSGATTGQVPQWNGTTWIPATVTSGGSSYVLPTASSSILGGVKVGAGLTINGSGVVSTTFTQASTDALYSPVGHVHVFSTLTSRPTTISGYGITDAFTQAQADAVYSALGHTHAFASLTSKPTTLSGYGITDAASLTHTHAFSAITSRPTTISGYGITDAFTQSQADAIYAAIVHTHAFAALTSKPTTLSGYGITDAATATGLSSEVTNRTNADNLKANIASPTFTGTPKIGADSIATNAYARSVAGTGGGGGTTYTATSPLSLTGTSFGIDPTASEDITTATATFSNKRIVPRVQTVVSVSSVTPSADNDDFVRVTAQAATLAIINPNGTPVSMQKITIAIKDNGVARTLNYGTQYRGIGVTLPTTTVANKWLYLDVFFNISDTKWDVLKVSQE